MDEKSVERMKKDEKIGHMLKRICQKTVSGSVDFVSRGSYL